MKGFGFLPCLQVPFWAFDLELPPAKIFMGDAGSGFLGVVLGALSVKAAWVAPELFGVG